MKAKIKVNINDCQLFCVYSKERIELDEKYVEIGEYYFGDEITKTYKYEYLNMLVDDSLENYSEELEITEG